MSPYLKAVVGIELADPVVGRLGVVNVSIGSLGRSTRAAQGGGGVGDGSGRYGGKCVVNV